MKTYRTIVFSTAASIALMPFAFAQNASPTDSTAPPGTSSPSAASSPHQRSATSTPAQEAPATNGTNPAAASSPHQAQVSGGSKNDRTGQTADAKQTMKACVAREQADHTGMAMTDAKKACKEQLKSKP
jgi:hypothetical protein